MPNLAEHLKRLRNNTNMTQKELASKLNVSQAAINYWENGKRTPSSDTLKQLSQIFQTDIFSLISDKKLYSESIIDSEPKNNMPGDITLEVTKENLFKYREYFKVAYDKAIEIAFLNHDSNKEWFNIKTGQVITHQELLDTFQNPTDDLILDVLKRHIKSITINETLQTVSITV